MREFSVQVPGIGDFIFHRRTFRDGLLIRAEYERLVGGNEEPSQWLDAMASSWSSIKVLLVEAPAGFDAESLDPDDDESYAKLVRIGAALAEKERSFRRQPEGAGAQGGSGNGRDNGVPVPAEVRPPAD